MIELTATVITFNEEGNIRECLESLSWVSTIIVVDSGSTDRTVEIAREYTDHVHVTDWPGHVEQKNRAISLAKTDWIISLDADERVSEELREEIIRNLQTEPDVPGFQCPGEPGIWVNGSVTVAGIRIERSGFSIGEKLTGRE